MTVLVAHLSPSWPLCSRLDTIATLDHVGFETDWSRPPVQLEEQSAGIT